MNQKLRKLLIKSDLIVVGRIGITTSTGGSTNAEIEVEEVLKGSFENKNLRIVISTMGASSSVELTPGERTILCLRAIQEGMPVYGLTDDDTTALIPFDNKMFQEIKTLLKVEP